MSMSLSFRYLTYLLYYYFNLQRYALFLKWQNKCCSGIAKRQSDRVVDGIGCAAFATAVECVEVEVLGVGGWVGV